MFNLIHNGAIKNFIFKKYLNLDWESPGLL